MTRGDYQRLHHAHTTYAMEKRAIGVRDIPLPVWKNLARIGVRSALSRLETAPFTALMGGAGLVTAGILAAKVLKGAKQGLDRPTRQVPLRPGIV